MLTVNKSQLKFAISATSCIMEYIYYYGYSLTTYNEASY